MSATEALKRKPVRSAADVCLCDHHADDHAASGACEHCNECKRYQPRPCKCGHSAHQGNRCPDRECKCKRYVPDPTPAFLLRAGVHAGHWKFGANNHLKALMRPTYDLHIRAYACVMLHLLQGGDVRVVIDGEMRHPGRMAVVINGEKDKGKLRTARPLQPIDIARILNEHDPLKRLDPKDEDRTLYRALRRVEGEGLIKVDGPKHRGQRQIYGYSTPLRKRTLTPDNPKSVSQKACTPDPLFEVNSQKTGGLPAEIILPMKSAAVKSFRSATDKIAQTTAQVPPGFAELRERFENEITEFAERKLRDLWAAAHPETVQPDADPVAPPAQPVPLPAHPLARIRLRFKQPINDPKLSELDARCTARLGDDYDRELLIRFIDNWADERAHRKKPYTTGVLFMETGGLIDDFTATYPQLAAETATAATAREQREQEAATAYEDALRRGREALLDPNTPADEIEIWLANFPELKKSVHGGGAHG